MKILIHIAMIGALSAAVRGAQAKSITVGKSGATHTTIQAGLSAAAAGDTVMVAAGVYGEAVSFVKSGSQAAGWITLKGQAGAIVDGTGLNGDGLISIESKSYVRVEGFEVRNLKGSGTPIGISISGGGSHIAILSNKVHHIENANGNAHGIAAYGDAATPISDLVVDGNEIHSCKLGQSESMVLNGNVDGFVVSRNVVHDNDNIGIDFIGYEGTGPGAQDQARNGKCFGNKVYNISSAANPTYGGERSADGIYVDGGRDIVIEGNVIDNCDIGIEIASEHGGKATANITVRNNFASRSWQGNIMAGGYAASKGSAENISIIGNTTYGGHDGELILQFNCKGVAIKNNIFQALSGGSYLEGSGSSNTNISVDNNLYFGGSKTSPGSWPDAHALYGDPKLQAPPSNLHLTAGSPAIGAGLLLEAGLAGLTDVDGEGRVAAGKPDIGADEFGGVTRLRPLAKGIDILMPEGARDGLGRRLGKSAGARLRF